MQRTIQILLILIYILGHRVNIVDDASVMGKVWNDFNFNGVMDESTIIGVPSIEVLAYNSDNQLVVSTSTDADGNYTLSNLSASERYRIEFIIPQSISFEGIPTQANQDNGTTVQFVNGGQTANLGVANPSDYCEENPFIAVPCYINNRHDAPEPTTGPKDVLVKIRYNGSLNGKATLANNYEIGSTWGLAFQQKSKSLFSAAFLKRHVGLPDKNNDGRADLANIYITNITTNRTSLWLDLSTQGIDLGQIGNDRARGLTANSSNHQNNDPSAFSKVGKVGFGDIDISDDGNTLYVVNLNSKEIIAIDISTKTIDRIYAIPNPACGGGEHRPFALKFYKEKLYAGVVCDAIHSKSQADLSATVYALDLTTGIFQSILNFPLNYTKASQDTRGWTEGNWRPWYDNINEFRRHRSIGNTYGAPSPILCDIEFDTNGDMILAFLDRTKHQFGRNNYGPSGNTLIGYFSGGDILRASREEKTYQLESNGTVGGLTSSGGVGNGEGPNGGEFYYGDHSNRPRELREVISGGLAFRQGSGEIKVVADDAPFLNHLSIATFSNTDGYRRGIFTVGLGGYKANGLGDVELLCSESPIQIGNYVWKDLNGNGRQDANEKGIEGVDIELWKNGRHIATTTTNEDGQYYFSSETIEALTIGENYIIRLPNASGINQQAALDKTILTIANFDNEANDHIDSDAVIADENADIIFSITESTKINHTLDFGFLDPCVSFHATPVLDCICPINSSTLDIPIDINFDANPIANGTQSIVISTDKGDSQTFDLNANLNQTFTFSNVDTTNSYIPTTFIIKTEEVCTDSFTICLPCFEAIGDTMTQNAESCIPKCNCEIGLISNIQSICKDNGTSNNPTDDYFTLTTTASGQQNGRYEVVAGVNTDGTGGIVLGTQDYGTAITVGDGINGEKGIFSVENTYTIIIRDVVEPSCNIDFTTIPLSPCSDECQMTLVLDPPIYNDNNTPEDLTDDTFTFALTVDNSPADTAGWQGGGKSGAYGEKVTFGPYAVGGEGVSFPITDVLSRGGCSVDVGVNMPSCVYTGDCVCCR